MPPKTPSKAKKAGSSASGSALRVGLHALVVVIAIFAASAATMDARLFLWRVARIPAVPDAGNAIFVGIAAYRDHELNHTLTDLFRKAKHPERVYVGLVNQEHRAVRDAPALSRWRAHPNVRAMEFDPEESKGAGWARSNIASMHRGEAYYMQLDSHHLFVRNWDAACVDLLKRLSRKSPSPS